MSMCRVFSCVVGRGFLLWPVHFLDKPLLVFALLHFAFQGQICLLLQVFLDFLLLHYTMPKPLTVWITINCGKFFKRWEYQTTWPASWGICMQVRKQQVELDMEQQTGSKQEKECVKPVYCHPAYLTYMQSTSWEMLGWKKHKLDSRLPGEISITSDIQMTPPLWQKVKKN